MSLADEVMDRAETPATDGLERLEEITTERREFPEPTRHGASGAIVLNDRYRDASEIDWDVPGHTNIPDGSLYQHARAAQYALDSVVDPTDGRERYVLTKDYRHPDEDESDGYAVLMYDSNWRAGTKTGGSYSPWYKYDLTLRPVDENGEIDWYHDAPRSLNVKIQPQADELVQKDGSDFEIPYGEGTRLQIQATWIEDIEELLERAAHLVGHALGYGVKADDVNPDSGSFWKAEQHYRVKEGFESEIVQTLRQSVDLLAHHGADVEPGGEHKNNQWDIYRVSSDQWHKLGFPILAGRSAPDIVLKLYYPENPESVEFPYDQPKVEVALSGKPDTAVDWSDWETVHAILENILVSHLLWANTPERALVTDQYADGAAADPTVIEHPDGRRAWLREHYESLVPELYREATKPNTNLVYDILSVIREADGPVTYQTLQEKTGAAPRTLRWHVRRLEEDVGGDGPGILKRVQDRVTFIDFSSRFFEESADDALDEVKPDDLPSDREERAEQRKQKRERENKRREQRDRDRDESDNVREDSDDDRDDSSSSETSPNTWRYLSDLSIDAEQAATAIEEQYVEPDHVRLRIDPYDWVS